MTPVHITRHNVAIDLRKADRSAEALAEIEAILATGFNAPETRLMRAHLLGDAGRYDEAVDAYRAVIARAPDMIDAHETLAKLLPQIGRSGEALDGYRAALAAARRHAATSSTALRPKSSRCATASDAPSPRRSPTGATTRNTPSCAATRDDLRSREAGRCACAARAFTSATSTNRAG